MTQSSPPLTRRERQILNVIYRKGTATAADIHAALPDAIRHVGKTFFAGSPSAAMTALIGNEGGRISEEELNRLDELVAQMRKRRRGSGK